MPTSPRTPRTPGPTPGPTPGRRSAAQVAAEDTTVGWPRVVARRLRRERADAITRYHRELAERAHQRRLALLWSGVHLGLPPYGYRLVERRLTPDPDTAAVVRFIYRLRVINHADPGTIVGVLRPHPRVFPRPVGRDGAPLDWSARYVRAVLANPRYTGRQVVCPARRINGHRLPPVITEPVHPALVDDRMWRLAQPPGRLLPSAILTAATRGPWLLPGLDDERQDRRPDDRPDDRPGDATGHRTATP